MVSAAQSEWRSGREAKLNNLLGAHVAVGGSGAGRRWATEELNHALVLRLASEFQGFCRDLHDGAVGRLVETVAPADPQLQQVTLWPDLKARYAVRGEQWRRKLELLNEARNGIAHDDATKIAKVRSSGWPVTLPTIRRWRSALDGWLAAWTM